MASLSYHSEHLAWKQRVQKEVVGVSRYPVTAEAFFPTSTMHASNPNHLRDEPFHHSPPKYTALRTSAEGFPLSTVRRSRARAVEAVKSSQNPAETKGKNRTESQPPVEGKSPQSRRDVVIRSSRFSASPQGRVKARADLDLLSSMQKVREDLAQQERPDLLNPSEDQLRYIQELEATLRTERLVSLTRRNDWRPKPSSAPCSPLPSFPNPPINSVPHVIRTSTANIAEMVSIRVHRRLVGTLLELSSVVGSTQLVLDNETPVALLHRIKTFLACYRSEIV